MPRCGLECGLHTRPAVIALALEPTCAGRAAEEGAYVPLVPLAAIRAVRSKPAPTIDGACGAPQGSRRWGVKAKPRGAAPLWLAASVCRRGEGGGQVDAVWSPDGSRGWKG